MQALLYERNSTSVCGTPCEGILGRILQAYPRGGNYVRRKIILVVALVVLLTAAIVVPAMAQSPPDSFLGSIFRPLAQVLPPGAFEDTVLGSLLGLPTSDSSSNNSLDPSVSGSSSSDSSVSSSSSSDPSSSSSTADPDPGVSQEFSERRIQSGSASPSSSFSNSGDNVNACPTTQQVVNTGNVANQQGVVQYNSKSDDISATGSSINIDSSVSAECTQTTDQAAAGK